MHLDHHSGDHITPNNFKIDFWAVAHILYLLNLIECDIANLFYALSTARENPAEWEDFTWFR